jgi:hypothetical protein
MKNWTQVLAERNNGQRPGFAVPADLDKRNKTDVAEEAERRGIDPADKTADELRAAVRGA